MARSPLTLAALATSALPEVAFVGSGELGHGGSGDFDSALLRGDDGRQYVVRVPTNQDAETDQARELLVLQALTDGIRSRLPFDVHRVLGQTPANDSRAVVYDFLPGFQVDAEGIPPGDGVATSMGAALAAVHALPGSFVGEAGLPVQSAAEARTETRSVIERAAATKLLPAAVRSRWLEAADDDALWMFQPTVVNGQIAADSFLITDHEAGPIVTGLIGWGSLRVGDPAKDLHWLSAAGDAAEDVFAAYVATSARTPDAMIRQRSMLYAELELARWLLHGRDTHRQEVVDDAVAMLDGLVDSVLGDMMSPLATHTGPVMTVGDVQALLERTPVTGPASSGISMETDSYDRAEFLRAWGEEDDADLPGDAEPEDEDDDATDEGPAGDDAAPDDDATGPIDVVQEPGATRDSHS